MPTPPDSPPTQPGPLGHAYEAPTLAPVQESERISSVDTLRGFALLGILAMNIIAFALPLGAYMNPLSDAVNRYAGEFRGLNAAVYYLCTYVFSQKMMTIFSMLFGAGLVLMDSRSARAADVPAPGHAGAELAARPRASPRTRFAPVYYRRLLWLFLFGMLHAYLVWFGDILVAYALCGLVLYPLRRLRPWALISMGCVLLVVCQLAAAGMGVGLNYLRGEAARAQAVVDAGNPPTRAQHEVMKAWAETSDGFDPPSDKVREQVEQFRGPPGEVLAINAGTAVSFQTFFFLINTAWWCTGVMLIGMALMRLGVFSASRPRGLYVTLAALGYAAGIPLTYIGQRHDFAHAFQMPDMFMVGLPLHSLGALATALGHVGVVMLLCRSGAAPRLTRRLAAVGRMAFTNYLTQSLICTAIFYGWGLGQYARWERAEVYVVVLAVWAAQLLWSPWWLARFRCGPAEWVWRSLTYWKRQPMRREAPAG